MDACTDRIRQLQTAVSAAADAYNRASGPYWIARRNHALTPAIQRAYDDTAGAYNDAVAARDAYLRHGRVS